MVSEALANAAKHAHASAADVEVKINNGALHVRVHDDGTGEPTRPRARGSLGCVTELRQPEAWNWPARQAKGPPSSPSSPGAIPGGDHPDGRAELVESP
jgi:hypothetical protein